MNSKRFHFMFFFNVQSNPSSIILTRHLATKQKRSKICGKSRVYCRVIQSIIQMPRCTWIYWFQGEKLIFISVKEFYCIHTIIIN